MNAQEQGGPSASQPAPGGQRKIDLVDLLAFEAIGLDFREAMKRLSAVKPD